MKRWIRRHIVRVDVEAPILCTLGLHRWRETGGGSRSIDGKYPSEVGYERWLTDSCQRTRCRARRERPV